MEWIFCFRKGNKRSNKIEKRTLPSEMQRIEKTREVQKVLQTLCDREDDDSSEKSFVSARFTQKIDTKNRDTNSVQKTILEVDLTDSSSKDSFVSCKRNKQNRNERNQKAKSVRNSSDRSTQKVSRSIIKEKNTKRYQRSTDSSDSTDSSETIARKYTNKRNTKSEKIVKRKTNLYLSDSESEENNTNRVSNISKRISKARQRNKKMDNQNSKDKTKKRHYLSESENEEYKRQNRKNTETNRVSYINNDEQKQKSSTKTLSNIQEDDSDNSSSKEFQKIKLQKVNRKYSTKGLVDLDIDYTKLPCTNNSANDKSEKHINESNQNFNDIKKILGDFKKMCSNFQMYIETIEQLYGKKDEEQFILRSMEKIDKLRTVLEKKQKDLTTSYQLWSKNRKKSDKNRKKSYKVINDDKESSEEREKCTEGENTHISGDEQDRNKTVSECDSEEIFSGNETRTPQKMRVTQCKADTSRTENSLNKNGTNIDNEDRMSMPESTNHDKNDMNTQDDLATSPILGTLKEKTSIERTIKKLSEYNKSNNETQLMNENSNTKNKQTSLNTDIYNNETEIEDSSRDSHKEKTNVLESDGTHQSDKQNIINESMDMFDTSLENVEESRTKEIETNYNEGESLNTSKDKFSNPCESSLQVPTEKEKTSILSCDGEEKDLSSSRLNQDDQEKMAFVISEEAHNSKTSGKTNTDNESLDDAEALAKKALYQYLLATDSDTLPDETVATLMEDLVTNDTNQMEKKNEMEDDSDVNSVSTIMLSSFIKEVNTDAEKNTTIDIEKKIKDEQKNDNRLDKKSRQEMSSSDEDTKAEEAAKKALLESNSDDSMLLSSESEKLTDKTSESDSFEKNAKAKRSLLESFSESSSSELGPSETANISKDTKYNHEPENKKTSIVTRLKKRKFKLEKNYYYKNDKKLRMSCQVQLTRLNVKVLRCHSHALRMSREYLEHKALKRYRELSIKRMSIVLHRLI